jgi:hypothetical protein
MEHCEDSDNTADDIIAIGTFVTAVSHISYRIPPVVGPKDQTIVSCGELFQNHNLACLPL